MSEQLKNILTHQQTCPSLDVFYNYIEGKMKKEDKHAFERHLASCEICEEALEGFAHTSRFAAFGAVTDINEHVKTKSKSIAFMPKMAIAASVAIVLLAGSWFFFQDMNKSESISMAEESKKEELEKTKEDKGSAEPIIETESETLADATQTDGNIAEQLIESPPKPDLDNMITMMEVSDEEEISVEEDRKKEAISYNVDANTAGGITEDALADKLSEAEEEVDDLYESGITTTKSNLTQAITTTSGNKGYTYSGTPINTDEMLAYANEVANRSFTTTTEKNKDNKSKKQTRSSNANEQIPSATYKAAEASQNIVNTTQRIKNEEYTTAENQIETQLRNTSDTNEKATLLWLKAASYIKQGKDARPILKELKKTDNPYKEKAKVLLKRFN